MVSITSGLAALAVLAIAGLAIGTSVVGASVAADETGPSPAGQARCDVASAVHGVINHRQPGQTVGSVISEIAQACRPDIRR